MKGHDGNDICRRIKTGIRCGGIPVFAVLTPARIQCPLLAAGCFLEVYFRAVIDAGK